MNSHSFSQLVQFQPHLTEVSAKAISSYSGENFAVVKKNEDTDKFLNNYGLEQEMQGNP